MQASDCLRRPIIPPIMPTYEYSCQKCGQNFEVFQSMRDEPFRECPKNLCRLPKWAHGKVKRLLGTGAGLIFKGSGFYITDYRSDSYKEAAKKEAPPTPAAAEKSTPRPLRPQRKNQLHPKKPQAVRRQHRQKRPRRSQEKNPSA